VRLANCKATSKALWASGEKSVQTNMFFMAGMNEVREMAASPGRRARRLPEE
jgi:hypothetical protein